MFLGVCSNNLKLYNWPDIKLTSLYELSKIKNFAWNNEGTQIFCTNSKGHATIIKPPLTNTNNDTIIEDQQLEIIQQLNCKDVSAAIFSTIDDSRAAIGTSKGEVKIFDLRHNSTIEEYYPKLKSKVEQIEYLYKDAGLIAGCQNGQVVLYNKNGKPCSTFEVPYSHTVSSITTHKKIPNLISAGSNVGYMSVWNVQTGDIILINEQHSGKISTVQFYESTVSAASVDGIFTTSDLKSQTLITSEDLDVAISSFAFLENSYELALSTFEGQLLRYDRRYMGGPVKTIETNSGAITKIAFPSNIIVIPSQQAAAGSGDTITNKVRNNFTKNAVNNSKDFTLTHEELEAFKKSVKKAILKRKLEFEKRLFRKFYAMRLKCCKSFINLEESISDLILTTPCNSSIQYSL